MANIEQLDPKMPFREGWPGMPDNYWRRPLMPSIRWGGVIAGAAVGMSVQLVMALLGLAMGLPVAGLQMSSQIDTGALIWAIVSMLLASFVGGFVAARLSGFRRKVDGLLHGAVFWAISTILFVAISSMVGGTILGGAFSSMTTGDVREAKVDDYDLTILLRGMIGGDASVSDVRTLQRYIRSGQREEATLLLSAMGMDPVQAATVVDQAMTATAGARPPTIQGVDLPDRTIRTGSETAWMVFGGVFLSLLLGMAGGLIGIMSTHRVIWNRPAGGPEKSADTTNTTPS